MATYLVSYDLLRPGKDYSSLRKHLMSYGNYAKPLESFWLIRTTREIVKLRDEIRAHMDANDKLFVVDVTSRACAWWNLINEVVKWIGYTL